MITALPNKLKIDRGDRVVVVMTQRKPGSSCRQCFGRGYKGRFTAGPEAGKLIPCKCIGKFREVR